MNRYTCDSHKSVLTDSPREAAEIFALRTARKQYGKAASVGALHLNSYSSSGDVHEFTAFIGYPSARNETTGHNIHLVVRVKY